MLASDSAVETLPRPPISSVVFLLAIVSDWIKFIGILIWRTHFAERMDDIARDCRDGLGEGEVSACESPTA